MTANEFVILCNEYGIDPAIAVESDEVRDALTDSLTSGSNDGVRKAIEDSF